MAVFERSRRAAVLTVVLLASISSLIVYLKEEVEDDGSTGVDAEVLHGGEGGCAAQDEGEEVRQRRV